MSRMVHEFSSPVERESGTAYTARVRGDEDHTGQWQGWIEFVALDGDGVLATGRETSQSTYEQLEYWATGLSPLYLLMALERAHPVEVEVGEEPPLLEEPVTPPDQGPASEAGRRLEIRTLDPSLPRMLMKAKDLPEGRVRRLKGGALLVYEGADAEQGEPTRHFFTVHFQNPSEAVVAANWIWTHVHDGNATVLVEERDVPVEPHALVTALTDAG